MRKLLIAGLLGCSLAVPRFAGAVPVEVPLGHPNAAVTADPAIQKTYWVWLHGRRWWRPAPFVYRPIVRPYYYHRPIYRHCWRRWIGGPLICR